MLHLQIKDETDAQWVSIAFASIAPNGIDAARHKLAATLMRYQQLGVLSQRAEFRIIKAY